jgi:hypothetical protein
MGLSLTCSALSGAITLQKNVYNWGTGSNISPSSLQRRPRLSLPCCHCFSSRHCARTNVPFKTPIVAQQAAHRQTWSSCKSLQVQGSLVPGSDFATLKCVVHTESTVKMQGTLRLGNAAFLIGCCLIDISLRVMPAGKAFQAVAHTGAQGWAQNSFLTAGSKYNCPGHHPFDCY